MKKRGCMVASLGSSFAAAPFTQALPCTASPARCPACQSVCLLTCPGPCLCLHTLPCRSQGTVLEVELVAQEVCLVQLEGSSERGLQALPKRIPPDDYQVGPGLGWGLAGRLG